MYRNKKEVVLLPVRNTPFIHPPRVWRHGLGGWLNPVQDGWRTSIIRVTSPPAQPFTHLPSVSFEQPTVWDVVLIITSPVNSSSIWISKTEACSNIWKESMSAERWSVTKNHKYHILVLVSKTIGEDLKQVFDISVRVKEKWVMLKKIASTVTVIWPLALRGLEKKVVHYLCALFAGKSSPTQLWPQPS